jgi:hypothetical protein
MSLASAIDGAAVIRNGLHLIFGIGDAVPYGVSPKEEETEVDAPYLERTPWLMIAPAILLIGVAIWVSLDMHVWRGIERAAGLFTGHLTLPVLSEHRTPESLGVNIGVTLLAVLLAFAALLREKIPHMLRSGMGAFSGVFFKLRLLHSGMYTDYVAYIMFGVAAYGVWLVVSIR